MHPVTAFYLSLCVLTAWYVRGPGEGRGEVFLALAALTTGAVLSNVAWFTNAIGNWVRIDAAVMLICLGLAAKSPGRWIKLAALSVMTMGIHAGFERLSDPSDWIMYVYPAALNAVLILQLLCVASNRPRGSRDHGSTGLVSSWPWPAGRHPGNVR